MNPRETHSATLDPRRNVSIIIPALNEAERIGEAVAKAWATGPAEVLVVDGHSDDQTADIARDAGARVLITPRGRAVQQNAGAREAQGQVLLFLHADTWLVPEGLGQIVAALGQPEVCGGAFRQRIEAAGWAYRLLERGNAWRARRQMPYGDQGIFVRREAFERLGGFPEVGLMEDRLLMKRLRRVGRLALLPGPLHVSARRWQRYGIARQTLRNWLLITAAELGIAPDRLARFYPAAAERACSQGGRLAADLVPQEPAAASKTRSAAGSCKL